MSYALTHDADDPDRPSLPGISEVALPRVRNICIVVVGLLFTFLILWWLRTVYTDLLWYGELGYRGVFTKILVMKIWLFTGGTIFAASVLIANFYFAFKFSRGPSTLPFSDETMRLFRALLVA